MALITTLTVALSKRTSVSFSPNASRSWGPRYLFAMTDSSSETYPLTARTSMRSRSGDRVYVVGGKDEEHTGEVDGDVHAVG